LPITGLTWRLIADRDVHALLDLRAVAQRQLAGGP
jgi:hypothetical protein